MKMLDKINLGISTFLAGMFTSSMILRLEHNLGNWHFPAILLGLAVLNIGLEIANMRKKVESV